MPVSSKRKKIDHSRRGDNIGKTLLSRLLRQTAHIRTAHFSLHTKRKTLSENRRETVFQVEVSHHSSIPNQEGVAVVDRSANSIHQLFSPPQREGDWRRLRGGGDRRVATQPWISAAAAAAAASPSQVRSRCRNPHPILEGCSGNEQYRSRVKV